MLGWTCSITKSTGSETINETRLDDELSDEALDARNGRSDCRLTMLTSGC
jgi:hypothetical protein